MVGNQYQVHPAKGHWSPSLQVLCAEDWILNYILSAYVPCMLENHETQAMKQATELLGIWSLVVRAVSFNVALCRAIGDDEDTKLF